MSTASPETWADVSGVDTQRAASSSDPYSEIASRSSCSWYARERQPLLTWSWTPSPAASDPARRRAARKAASRLVTAGTSSSKTVTPSGTAPSARPSTPLGSPCRPRGGSRSRRCLRAMGDGGHADDSEPATGLEVPQGLVAEGPEDDAAHDQGRGAGRGAAIAGRTGRWGCGRAGTRSAPGVGGSDDQARPRPWEATTTRAATGAASRTTEIEATTPAGRPRVSRTGSARPAATSHARPEVGHLAGGVEPAEVEATDPLGDEGEAERSGGRGLHDRTGSGPPRGAGETRRPADHQPDGRPEHGRGGRGVAVVAERRDDHRAGTRQPAEGDGGPLDGGISRPFAGDEDTGGERHQHPRGPELGEADPDEAAAALAERAAPDAEGEAEQPRADRGPSDEAGDGVLGRGAGRGGSGGGHGSIVRIAPGPGIGCPGIPHRPFGRCRAKPRSVASTRWPTSGTMRPTWAPGRWRPPPSGSRASCSSTSRSAASTSA